MIWNDMELYIESHGKSTGVYTLLDTILFLITLLSDVFSIERWPAVYV